MELWKKCFYKPEVTGGRKMLRYLPIRMVHARQVLDSRGNPTVEVEVTVGEGVVGVNGYTARAMVPRCV